MRSSDWVDFLICCQRINFSSPAQTQLLRLLIPLRNIRSTSPVKSPTHVDFFLHVLSRTGSSGRVTVRGQVAVVRLVPHPGAADWIERSGLAKLSQIHPPVKQSHHEPVCNKETAGTKSPCIFFQASSHILGSALNVFFSSTNFASLTPELRIASTHLDSVPFRPTGRRLLSASSWISCRVGIGASWELWQPWQRKHKTLQLGTAKTEVLANFSWAYSGANLQNMIYTRSNFSHRRRTFFFVLKYNTKKFGTNLPLG